MASRVLTVALGKAARALARIRGGGTAFPGKVVETIDHRFLPDTLAQLPCGVVLVSGTNGKTTTTRIVASLLESLGLTVFTNPTGSNFTRGVVSALIDKVDFRGRLDADIAVLELDEAYAVHFVHQVKPRYTLLLNVMRDQLDRFGEIDTTARLLSQAARATEKVLVLNREDPRISKLALVAPQGTEIRYFGLADSLLSFFPSDDAMHDEDSNHPQAHGLVADVVLTAVDGHRADYEIDGSSYSRSLRLEGVYNLFNGAAALSLVRSVMKDVDAARGRHTQTDDMLNALAEVTPAFGRGESVMVGDTPVQMILVKNPMGFRLALKSFPSQGADTMIAINDEYADGRDMSWLWDVDFSSLQADGVSVVSGIRADDMALRLAYDQVPVGKVNSGISQAVKQFVSLDPGKPHHIYCTYTAMLTVRQTLSSLTEVEDVGL